ncbi:MAG: hypothetical protein VZQ83_00380 [Eubacterium sp.]|nr:hypothetical protein [Eubacterium sp.]
MKQTKNMSWLNCIATGLLVFILTIPMHELFHALTYLIYGDKISWFSAGAVQSPHLIDPQTLSPFNRIMICGGSASIMNFIIAIIILFILIKCKKMGATLRVVLIQLFGAQMATAVGYFFFGGLIGMGDWGNVWKALADMPGLVTTLRIILIAVGAIAIVFTFFVLNYYSYDFIHDPADKKERFSVASKLHLTMFIMGMTVPFLTMIKSPMIAAGELTFLDVLFFNMAWIVFFWGFMFTWVMVKHPKESRFKNDLPAKPNYVLLAISVILVLLDIFVLGPGLFFD